MATYRFRVEKHIDGNMTKMTKTDFVDVELSDDEYRSIKSDDGKYSKGSALLSSKLGEKVQSLGFPTEMKASKGKSKNEKKTKKNKSSLWRPLWAFPFKLIWRLLTGF